MKHQTKYIVGMAFGRPSITVEGKNLEVDVLNDNTLMIRDVGVDTSRLVLRASAGNWTYIKAA